MLHYLLQRGILPEKIINRTAAERLFFVASVKLAIEQEREKLKSLVGG
jgi:hypothetical protein